MKKGMPILKEFASSEQTKPDTLATKAADIIEEFLAGTVAISNISDYLDEYDIENIDNAYDALRSFSQAYATDNSANITEDTDNATHTWSEVKFGFGIYGKGLVRDDNKYVIKEVNVQNYTTCKPCINYQLCKITKQNKQSTAIGVYSTIDTAKAAGDKLK